MCVYTHSVMREKVSRPNKNEGKWKTNDGARQSKGHWKRHPKQLFNLLL